MAYEILTRDGLDFDDEDPAGWRPVSTTGVYPTYEHALAHVAAMRLHERWVRYAVRAIGTSRVIEIPPVGPCAMLARMHADHPERFLSAEQVRHMPQQYTAPDGTVRRYDEDDRDEDGSPLTRDVFVDE